MVAPAIKEFRHRESCESDESFGGKKSKLALEVLEPVEVWRSKISTLC
jgi:hypothetical protein